MSTRAGVDSDIPPSKLQHDLSLMETMCIGYGGSANVFDGGRDRVVKVFPVDEQGQNDLQRELDIYSKLQEHESSDHITRFLGRSDSGLVLERHRGTVRQALRKMKGQRPQTARALRWSKETCGGLQFLHDHGVYHGDMGCQNILLDSADHIKICDFAGSRLRTGGGEDDWEDAWISYEVRSQHPKFRGKQPTMETEIFSLGSVLFELWTSKPPYVQEKDSTVQQKFLAYEFPLSELYFLGVRDIVRDCWTGVFNNASEVCTAFEQIEDALCTR